jgi:hypothetical protein
MQIKISFVAIMYHIFSLGLPGYAPLFATLDPSFYYLSNLNRNRALRPFLFCELIMPRGTKNCHFISKDDIQLIATYARSIPQQLEKFTTRRCKSQRSSINSTVLYNEDKWRYCHITGIGQCLAFSSYRRQKT